MSDEMPATSAQPRYALLGPCPSGFVWHDSHTGRYEVYGADVNPNERQREIVRDRAYYCAGWHSV